MNRLPLFLLLAFPLTLSAAPGYGKLELERDIAHTRVDYDYMVKICKQKPKAKASACLKEVAANRDRAIKGLKQREKEKS